MSVVALRGPKLRHDGMITIATGAGRKSVHWKNEAMLWSQLLARLSEPIGTEETLAEYRAMPKSQQDDIKDVGGFVGGELAGGRRKASAVARRHLLTLDVDHVLGDFWAGVQVLFDHAACVYSTHSHSPERPRLRLVIPLSRPITPEETQAVARRVAADFGIDQFDPTTFEPHRLMYWPSSPRDVDPVFHMQDAPWLDPDTVLATYPDWRDPSYWPEPERAQTSRQKLREKAEDPTEKRGVVGAFCRTYSIEEAIETHLPGVYESEKDGRFTYVAGSTTGGLVVYDDGKFAYSHHGTDPCSGRLVNAFDLVRLHKFAELDDEAEPGTPVVRMPSYTAMVALARDDTGVQKTIDQEMHETAKSDFGEPVESDDMDHSWKLQLKRNAKGAVDSSRHNIITILENDPWLKGKIALNEFTGRSTITGAVPWDKRTEYRSWSDADDAGLRHYLERSFGVDHASKTDDALQIILGRRRFHPVRDYLRSLTWDGTPRVETLLVDYLGAVDGPYVRAVTRKSLVAAVARVETPGCKWDYVLTLVGPQGIGKSLLADKLAKDWFTDSLSTVLGKEAYEILQGKWIVEMGELAATRKADIENIKHFLTKREDRFRVAYGKHAQDFPRQMVIWATTNNLLFLRDVTGNRRWWPVSITGKGTKSIRDDLTQEQIDQVWAETYQFWKQGELLYLPAELEDEAMNVQAEHTEESERAGEIRSYLDLPLPKDWDKRDVPARREYIHGSDFGDEPKGSVCRERVCVMEIWVELFRGNSRDLTPWLSREIHDILRATPGWKPIGRQKFGKLYGQQRAYGRVTD